MVQVRITHSDDRTETITTSGDSWEIVVQRGDQIDVGNATVTSATVDGNDYIVIVEGADGAIVTITFKNLFLLLAVGALPESSVGAEATTGVIGEEKIASIGEALSLIATAADRSGDGVALGDLARSGGARPDAVQFQADPIDTPDAPRGPLLQDFPFDVFRRSNHKSSMT